MAEANKSMSGDAMADAACGTVEELRDGGRTGKKLRRDGKAISNGCICRKKR